MGDSATAMAAIIPEKKLIRVLVIDDEDRFQQDIKDYFETYGYAVDAARSPQEAKAFIAQKEYQIVIVDVNFEGIELDGDRFILQNYKDFKGARLVVATGLDINTLRNHVALKRHNIPVWDKGDDDFGKYLNDLTEETAQARKQKLAGQLNDFISDKLGGSGDYIVTGATAAVMTREKPERAPWEAAIENIMVLWLESQKNQKKPFLSVGRTVLSPLDMIDHVKRKTNLGNELLKMFVVEVGQSLGIEIESTSGR
ncbi:MAG TPA: response regulator [Pyrinomonadaceae bacterium]|jgi:CheY-like chemotaxis protein